MVKPAATSERCFLGAGAGRPAMEEYLQLDSSQSSGSMVQDHRRRLETSPPVREAQSPPLPFVALPAVAGRMPAELPSDDPVGTDLSRLMVRLSISGCCFFLLKARETIMPTAINVHTYMPVCPANS